MNFLSSAQVESTSVIERITSSTMNYFICESVVCRKRGNIDKEALEVFLGFVPHSFKYVVCICISHDVSNSSTQLATALRSWVLQHEKYCDKNHSGSAAKMEPDGTEIIFHPSLDKYNLRYVRFLGDGDSKSYSAVKNADPPIYEGTNIKKLECCGHLQKRMGRQLMNRVQELKNKTFEHSARQQKELGAEEV